MPSIRRQTDVPVKERALVLQRGGSFGAPMRLKHIKIEELEIESEDVKEEE